jgi:hypothetical protein
MRRFDFRADCEIVMSVELRQVMAIERKKRTVRPAGARVAGKKTRIEAVDHSHARWAIVLKLIGRLGDRGVLLLDEDGWLSARQTVLAAFAGDKPIAYLIFRVHPVGDGRVEARLDAMSFAATDAGGVVQKALTVAALGYCRRLKCVRFKGLKA